MKSIKVLLSTVLCFCILLVENGYSKNITENSKIIKILSIGNSMGHRTKRFFQWSGKMGERF